MKIKLLSLFLISFVFRMEAQLQDYTSVPDKNFEKALSLFDDVFGDGKVPSVNIKYVNSLNVRGMSIQDLTGIEGFVSLEFLDCSDNYITVADFSSNNQLETLVFESNGLKDVNLKNNKKLSSLSLDRNKLHVLDVTGNPLLINLSFEMNEVEHIDLTFNTFLEQLFCQENNLKDLDVSRNTKIISIYCSSNSLRFLNIGNGNNKAVVNFHYNQNPFLEEVFLDNDMVENGRFAEQQGRNWKGDKGVIPRRLSELFVSVPDRSFESALIRLGVDKGRKLNGMVLIGDLEEVEELDVSGIGIKSLEGINYFTALKELIISDNSLIRVDLSSNRKLERVVCSGNNMEELLMLENRELKHLEASNNRITSLDLTKNAKLEYLDVSDNDLTDLNLAKNVKLQTLLCASNEMIYIDLTQNVNLRTAIFEGNEGIRVDLGDDVRASFKF